MHLPPAAHRLFATQHGAASRAQLIETGLTARQLMRLVARGDLINLTRQAYVSPSVEQTEMTRAAALCLARPEVVIAGPTAGRLWGLRKVQADQRLHVIARPAANPSTSAGVVTYRTALLRDVDIVRRDDGITVTSLARTALDLTRILSSPDDALSIIEQVAQIGHLSNDDLRAVAEHISTRRRPWVRTFYELVDRRLDGGAAESDGEVRVGDALVARGVEGLVRQFEVQLTEHRFARFDHAIPTLRWAVEVDLHPRHRETQGRLDDERRDAAAASAGWIVDRVTESAYRNHFESRIEELVCRYRSLLSEQSDPLTDVRSSEVRETHALPSPVREQTG